jgi:hypothetical protein
VSQTGLIATSNFMERVGDGQPNHVLDWLAQHSIYEWTDISNKIECFPDRPTSFLDRLCALCDRLDLSRHIGYFPSEQTNTDNWIGAS